MRIFDITKTTEILEPNIELGYLREDTLTIHHDAVIGVDEQGHWVTVAEYPNGSKDVEWVVDVEGVEAKEAYDETENVYIYVPYTEAELNRINAEKEIQEQKEFLEATDYVCSKIVEAQLEGGSELEILKAEYAEILARRKGARARINELERML